MGQFALWAACLVALWSASGIFWNLCVCLCWCVLRWQLCWPTVRCVFFFFSRLWFVTCLCTQASKSHVQISHFQQSPCASGAISWARWQTWGTWLEVPTWFFFLLPTVAVCVCVWERYFHNDGRGTKLCQFEARNGGASLGKEWNIPAWNFYG